MTAKNNLYIVTGESYKLNKTVRDLKESIQNAELNVTEYHTMPSAEELKAVCAEYPFLSDKRLVILRDCKVLYASGNAEEAKKIALQLDIMPDSTALVLCCTEPPDKRRTLYKKIAKAGTVREFPQPSPSDCSFFVQKQAKALGARISAKTAQFLVSLVGCDYYALENEVNKLSVYSGSDEITHQHLLECASKTLEYNVFEIHKLFAGLKAQAAYKLLSDILMHERPEALIGLVARKIRDMYKIRTMRDAGFDMFRIEAQMKMKSFAVKMLYDECDRFSADQLRDGLKALADLDYQIKSGRKDAALALHETLCRIYGLS